MCGRMKKADEALQLTAVKLKLDLHPSRTNDIVTGVCQQLDLMLMRCDSALKIPPPSPQPPVLWADPLCSKAATIPKTWTPHQVDPPACNGWRRFILGVGLWQRQSQAMSRSENGRARWMAPIAIAIPPGR